MSAPLDRIKKLLRMKRGGTPAEIETALSLAREIAAKHGIDIESVDVDEKSGSAFTHQQGFMAAKVRYDENYAAMLVKQFFNVDIVYQQSPAWLRRYLPGKLSPIRISFVGRVFEIEIAIYVFNFLRTHFSRSWRDRKNRRLRRRQSFVYGMYVGIYHKLQEQQVAPTSQSVVLTRESYLAEKFPDLQSTKSKSPQVSAAGMREGYREGQRTELRKGVEQPRPRELSL